MGSTWLSYPLSWSWNITCNEEIPEDSLFQKDHHPPTWCQSNKLEMAITNTLPPASEWKSHKQGPVSCTHHAPVMTPNTTIKVSVRKISSTKGSRMHRSLNLGNRRKSRRLFWRKIVKMLREYSLKDHIMQFKVCNKDGNSRKEELRVLHIIPLSLEMMCIVAKGQESMLTMINKKLFKTQSLKRIRVI